jgi:hypothetical protein
MIANNATEASTGTSSLHLAARRACLPGQARVTPGTLGAETPAEVVTEAEQMPRRARYLVPRGLPRRDEVLAVCVVAVVLVHLLFAQLTIVIATVLYLITKVTRWRLSWLTVPAAAGLAWTAAVGPRAAAAGFTAGPAQIVDYLTASGHQADHLLHFTDAFSGMGNWLPRQLPLALLAGTAEAALAGWLTWLHTDESDLPPARPGLIVAARRAATVRAIRAGGVVTRDGGCLGVAAGSGARITVSWAEVADGVSVCGSSGPDVLTTGFQLVHAAVRRRKPVLAVDHTADPELTGKLAAVCAAAGAPLLVFGEDGAAGAGTRAACYEPFRHGAPGRRAALITAMLSWDGPGRQHRRSCVSYLEDVFELLDAAPGDARVPVLDDVIHLLNPVAMRARMEYVPAAYPRREVLAERVRVSTSLVTAEPATIAEMGRQLRDVRASPFGRWLRPSPDGRAADIDLSRDVAERAVVLFRLGGPRPAETCAMLSRLVCQDLLAAGTALNGIGVDGDGIIWLAECGALPRPPVSEMIARGRDTGLPVLAATTSAQVAADLADMVNVVVAHRTQDATLAARLASIAPDLAEERDPAAAGTLGSGSPAALRDGEFLLAVKNPPRLVPRGLLVRARVPSAAAGNPDPAAAPRRAWEGA